MSQIWNTSGIQLHPDVLSYTAQDDAKLDQEVFLPYDIQGSLAHAKMLLKMGILSDEDLQKIQECLAGEIPFEEGMEDCHTALEAALTKLDPDLGKKIHTARSRNDQALTMIRLYSKDQLQNLMKLCSDLVSQWQAWSAKHTDTPMPGYTHMQKAMPTTVGMWQSAYADLLTDLSSLLDTALQISDQSPLGSGAGFGIPLEIDRELTANTLGFARVQDNPIACQLSRGPFESVTGFALLQVMDVLSRWANDLLLFTTSEYDYFELSAEYCTSSSIMPQKKNYDALEIMRGSRATVFGAVQEMEALQNGLHSGYHRDLQLLKKPLIRAFFTTAASLKMATLLSGVLEVKEKQLQAAMSDDLYATHKVYELVQEGMSFREAYAQVKKNA